MATDSRVEDILRQQSQMEAQRAPWEAHWQEISERLALSPRAFAPGSPRTPGGKMTETVFDSTAALALPRFAAVMESMLTPRTQQWHSLRPPKGLQDDAQTLDFCEAATRLLFRARYSPAANYASQTHGVYESLGALGTGALFTDDHPGRGLRYRAIPLCELFIAENAQGQVDLVHRRFELTARQGYQVFGEALPPAILTALKKEPERRFEFVHCVRPRQDAAWSRLDYAGMDFASYYVALEGRTLLREGGYRTLRYAVSRYVGGAGETYGRSPAMTVLAEIKTANEQAKTLLRVGQRMAEPPLLLSDDGAIGSFSFKSNALNFGAIGGDGRPLVMPLEVGGNMPVTLEMQQDTRGVIREAFLADIFKALIEHPGMTATQALLLAQQQGMLVAPMMGRQQSEMLGPQIAAELDILGHAGVLPPMPPQLAEQGGLVEIEYASPLARAQRADEGLGILRTLEQAVELAQLDPDTALAIKVPQAIRELAAINGMPQRLMNTPDEVAALKAARAEDQQLAALLQAAPVIGRTAKDLAGAQAMLGSGGLVAPILGGEG